jgi:hypothetical protein
VTGSYLAGAIVICITAVAVFFFEKLGLVFILTAGGMFLLMFLLERP